MCTVMLEDWYGEGERALTEVRKDKHRPCCWKEWNKSSEWTRIAEMLKDTAEQVRHKMKIETANSVQGACSNQDSFNTTTLSPIFHVQQRNFIKQFKNYLGDYRKACNEQIKDKKWTAFRNICNSKAPHCLELWNLKMYDALSSVLHFL